MKINKKLGALLLGMVMTTVGFAGCSAETTSGENIGDAGNSKELNIICWSEYIPDEIIADFEAETGVQINITTYNASDEMLAKVQSSAPDTYDMIVGTGVNTSILKEQDMIAELDVDKIPNITNIDPIYMSTPNDPDNKYGVPYLYTSGVIAVNTDVIKDEITSYEDLLRPEYKDSIVIIEDTRTVVAMALLAKGFDINDVSDEALGGAKDYLMALKPNIHAFNGSSPKTLLLNGECPIGLIYGGECAIAMDQNPAIVGIYPEEGIYFETDMMMKTKGAKNPDNVEKFINYICDAEVSAKVSTFFPYINPNKAAREFMSEEFLSNNIKVIPDEEVKGAQTLKDIGDDITKIVDLWTEFKN